ncbi:MAG: hypothetical protein FVQ80_15025 [Planctomycetes bacterium]|nr:hypothetical protein [Planctomycetota bacterium]
MNTDEKKRISISVPLDMIEKIERINQDEYYGCVKFQHVMLNMINLGFFAVDYFDGFKTAWDGLAYTAKQREKELDQEQGLAEYKKRALSKILHIITNPEENECPPDGQAEGARP